MKDRQEANLSPLDASPPLERVNVASVKGCVAMAGRMGKALTY